jgi:hypothetical protein
MVAKAAAMIVVEGASVIEEIFLVLSPVFNLKHISVVVLSAWLSAMGVSLC